MVFDLLVPIYNDHVLLVPIDIIATLVLIPMVVLGVMEQELVLQLPFLTLNVFLLILVFHIVTQSQIVVNVTKLKDAVGVEIVIHVVMSTLLTVPLFIVVLHQFHPHLLLDPLMVVHSLEECF